MYQTITKSSFRDAFHHMNRSNQFSYEGLGALFDYLDSEDYELDVIEICCEYTEYENLVEYNESNATQFESIEELENESTCLVIKIDDESFITSN